MRKKILLSVACLGAVVASAAMFAAFEAHVINVTAKIENALYVNTTPIEFGQVFPQEEKDYPINIALSDSFKQAAETIGTQYATEVVSYTEGDGITDPDRKDSSKALYAPENNDTMNFVSLGRGGELILGFEKYIVNEDDADDLEIFVTETSYGSPSCSEYPEMIEVYASKYGTNWTKLGTAQCLDASFDLGTLEWAKYLKLVDVTDPSWTGSDGYDVDGVEATSVNRLGIVDYMIRQKPKCTDGQGNYGLVTEDTKGNFVCVDEGYTKLPVLCPYLSKHSEEGEDDGNINAFHGDMDWTMQDTTTTQVLGSLMAGSDESDTWIIDFKAPCFYGECAQDWADFVTSANPEADPADYMLGTEYKGEELGCDLWIEVYGIDDEAPIVPGTPA